MTEEDKSAIGDAAKRVQELQAALAKLEGEIKSLIGKEKNRNPAILEAVKKQNEEFLARETSLKKMYFALLQDAELPRQLDEGRTQIEAVRQAAIELCQTLKLDPESWKNLVS